MSDVSSVSVVIPTYDRVRYLAEAIDSVLAQRPAPLELIVVDDGSTDETPAVLAGYGTSLRVIRQDNRGIGAARNAGVALARGGLLAFLDSDDVWVPGKLARQLAVFRERPQTEAVYGGSEPFPSPDLPPESLARIRGHDRPRAAPLPSALLVRRPAFDRVGPFDERLRIGVDMDWYARATEARLDVVMLEAVLYRRRLHESNFNRTHAHEQSERLRVLKATLDRRRRIAYETPPGGREES